MSFADKLITLRRQKGWSQEELAARMDVTRQSVSKWESAQSVPDLDRIVRLSQLFKVSTDELLKDDVETISDHTCKPAAAPAYRSVSPQDAEEYLALRQAAAKPISRAVFVCILSPICLLLLGAAGTSSVLPLTETAAGCIGMIILLVLVGAVLPIFITHAQRAQTFAWLRQEPFELEEPLRIRLQAHRQEQVELHKHNTITGICLCAVALIPLLLGTAFRENDVLFLTAMLCLGFIIAGCGVMLLVQNGIRTASFDVLLQEGDYSRQNKKRQPVLGALTNAYWLIALSIYLAYSFVTNNWGRSWIIWPVAAVLYPVLPVLWNVFSEKKK